MTVKRHQQQQFQGTQANASRTNPRIGTGVLGPVVEMGTVNRKLCCGARRLGYRRFKMLIPVQIEMHAYSTSHLRITRQNTQITGRRSRSWGMLAVLMTFLTTHFAFAQDASPDSGETASSTATCWIVDVVPGAVNLASESDVSRDDGVSKGTRDWRWFSPAIRQRKLRIGTFDSKRMTATAGGSKDLIQVRSDQVVWVRPERVSEEERLGLSQLAQGQSDAAMRGLLKSLESRPPIWRQQFLSMAAAQCAARSGRGAITIELVRQLDQRPLPTFVLGWLPIEWRRGVVPVSAKREVERLEAESSPLAELVRASWGMELNRAESVRVLDQISERDDRPLVAALAALVRFRAANPIEGKQRWRTVKQQIEELPMSLQMGPMVMLAGKLMAIGEKEHADQLITSLELVPVCPHPDVPASMEIWKP